MDQELVERIDLIERMMAEGRRTTQYWGWCFALWGTGQLVALVSSIFVTHTTLIWSLAMGTCGVVTGLVIASKRKTQKTESLVSRSITAVWFSFGITISLLSFLGQPAGLFNSRAICVIFLALMGLVNSASGAILRWPLQTAAGIAWWAAAVVVMFGPEQILGWTLIVMIVMGEIVFGLYLMARERAANLHA